MSLRFFSIGDIHHNMTRLQRAVEFANAAGRDGKCSFIVQSGDIVSSTASLTQLNDAKAKFDMLTMPYFVASGNHDVSGDTCYSSCTKMTSDPCAFRTVFGSPDRIHTVTKDGIEYQIVTVGICSGSSVSCPTPPGGSTGQKWIFNFDRTDLSKTKPTIVVNHGPLMRPSDTSCGNWDCTHSYAIVGDLKSKTDTINMLASYSGHTHAARQTMLDGRLYAVQDSINGSRCSSAESRFIGYTKITKNDDGTYKVDYKNMEFVDSSGNLKVFIDPFPDAVTKRYKCTGAPDYQCVEDPNGPYISLEECRAACSKCSGTITVYDPDSRDNWVAGSKYSINWTISGETGAKVKIDLLKGECFLRNLFTSTTNDGGKSWTIPSDLVTASDYQIRVTGVECPNIVSTSQNFTISGGTPAVKYRCTGTPDYQCVEDTNGPYSSLEECLTACKPPQIASLLGTFYYPWFGGNAEVSPSDTWRHWKSGSHSPPNTWACNYLPDTLPTFDPCNELYSSKDVSIVKLNLSMMKRAGIQFVISSWWGQNSYEDQALDIIFKVLNSTCNPHPNVKFCIYYEREGYADVSTDQILSDINYINNKYAGSKYYLKINEKPVIFVYNTSTGSTDLQKAQKWDSIRKQTGIFTVLKVFSGYKDVATLSNSWHQYAPSKNFEQQGNYSAFVSPGFHKYHENPRLARENFIRFEQDIAMLSTADVQFKLVETWNEWGEGTGIEPAQKINHDDINGFTPAEQSYGTKYIDILAKYFTK